MHRFLLILADVFLGYWVALFSKRFLPLQLLLGPYHFLYYVEFIKLCSVAFSAVSGCLWHEAMFVVAILSSMSNIIKYEDSMTFFYQKE